ncbi:MAG: 30S ribosomal protein S1, partial [Chloroflexi bacterium]|nr:30S ribosomal protein S1 [Chloroflexota bacterium]
MTVEPMQGREPTAEEQPGQPVADDAGLDDETTTAATGVAVVDRPADAGSLVDPETDGRSITSDEGEAAPSETPISAGDQIARRSGDEGVAAAEGAVGGSPTSPDPTRATDPTQAAGGTTPADGDAVDASPAGVSDATVPGSATDGSASAESPSATAAGTQEGPDEAAIGSSGEAPLGAADALAQAASDAVDTGASSDAETSGAPVTDGQAPATDGEAPAAADRADAAPDGAAAATTPSAEAAPVVDDRPEPTTMEELLSEQTDEIRSLKHGDVVEGQVVRIDKDEILVDIGAKSEGVVSNRELYGRNTETQPQLDIGDTVLVYVLQPESNEGHAVLSLRRAGLERKWRSMQEQLDAGVIIEAPVIDHNKGGLIVDCGIRGFVPISQIVDFPRRPQNEQPRDAAQEIAEKLQPYVGRKLRLKILEVNRKANRLILSEKVALYEERREKRDELFSSLQVGQKVTGSVRSIAPFGVFVDLGGIDGLVHKSELSWNKVNNPEAGYRVGEEVEAEVIDINHERGRISLSIRRLQPDPWASTVADLKVGDVIEGVVTKIVNFGAFVRVRDGLEGLIHISELSHQRVAHPGDVVHESQKLDLKVISLDSERHRLGLSLKQAEEAPARTAPTETRERRGGGRSGGPAYDPTQAVQEPEEGIDNTLAAAFAAVRQQVADSEAAASRTDDQPADEDVVAEATGDAASAEAVTAEASGVDAASEQDTASEATTAEAADSAIAAEAGDADSAIAAEA